MATAFASGPGREFMGAVIKEMEKHKTNIRRRRVDIHRDQVIVERFNRTLYRASVPTPVCCRNAPARGLKIF